MASATAQTIELQPDVKLHISLSTPSQPTARAKPTLVFLHFWGGSSATWAKVISLLSDKQPTVSIDFRGWGRSTGPDDETKYSIIQLAQDVERVVQHLTLTSYVLVGHSMGAKVAQAVAGRRVVDGLQGLVLLAPAPPTPLVLPSDMREQQIHAYDDLQGAEFVTRNVLTANKLAKETVECVVRDMLRGNRWARAAWPGHAMADDILEQARKITVPVLAICAAQDVVEPVSRVKSDVCAHIPGCQLLVIQESGHLLPLEAPEEVENALSSFILQLK